LLKTVDDHTSYPVTRLARSLPCLALCAMSLACSFESVRGAQDAVDRGLQPRPFDDIRCPAMPVVSPERMRLIIEPEPRKIPKHGLRQFLLYLPAMYLTAACPVRPQLKCYPLFAPTLLICIPLWFTSWAG